MSRNNSGGFTVTELLIAMALFGIIVPLFAVGINNLTVLHNRARDLVLVNTLAYNKFELLRSSGYNSVTLGTVDFSSELPTTLASPNSASYTVTTPTAGIKEVVVDISYREYSSTRNITYKSLISETGVAQ